jgi:hypothetical protein
LANSLDFYKNKTSKFNICLIIEKLEVSSERIRSLKQVLSDVVNSDNYKTNGSNYNALQQLKLRQGMKPLPKKSIFDFKNDVMQKEDNSSSLNTTIKGLPKWATKLRKTKNY